MKQKPSGNKSKMVEYEVSLEDFRAKLAIVTVCDEKGNILFKPQDVKLLNESMSASNLDKIVTVAQKLNRITEQDKEDILKNSEADPEGSSSSDSANS